MIESFVDLTYRGLPLGRRVKLTQVRSATGYLELPAPMPVGTTIGITTDEGLAFEGRVTAIHEQVGGSDKPPGMRVMPALDAAAVASWWGARASDEPEPVEPPRPPPITAAPPSAAPSPAPADAPTVVAAPLASDAGDAGDTANDTQPIAVEPEPPKAVAAGYVKRRTKQSSAVPPPLSDAELMAAAASLATLPKTPPGATPTPAGDAKGALAPFSEQQSTPVDRTPTLPMPPIRELADDGKRTTVMEAVDPALLEQLMAESRPSGQMAAVAPPDGSGDGRTMMMTAVDLSALGLETGTSGEMAAVPGEIDGEVSGEITDESSPVDAGPGKTGGAPKKRRTKRR